MHRRKETRFVLQNEIQSTLAEALLLHKSGQLPAAKAIYATLIARHGDLPDVLHLAGVADYQSGEYDQAEKKILRAIQRNGHIARYYGHLGLVLEASGKARNAEDKYRHALHMNPEDPDSYLNLGNLLLRQERVVEAASVLQQLLRRHPQLSAGYNSLGCALLAQNKPEAAINCFQKALQIDPRNVKVMCNLGGYLQRAGKTDEALVCFRSALHIEPGLREALNPMGVLLRENGHAAEAVEAHRAALGSGPNHVETLVQLGMALRYAGAYEDAAAQFRRVLVLQPGSEHATLGLANVLVEQGKLDEAKETLHSLPETNGMRAETFNTLGVILDRESRIDEACLSLRKAIDLKPDFYEAYNNLGLMYWNRRSIAEARELFEKSLHLHPNYAEARWNLALLQLITGEYQTGWKNYEARWHRRSAPRSFDRPLWSGQPLAGKRILLHHEQGLGDTLQFLRFVPLVQQAGGQVILDVPERMIALAAALPRLLAVTAPGSRLPEFDLHCPLMSLPGLLGITLENLPAQPYLQPTAYARKQAQEFPWTGCGLRVGLCWAGSNKNATNALRSIVPDDLAPLLGVKHVHFVSLQMEAQPQSATAASMQDCTAFMQDLDTTAALIEQLDLVISVDTMVAHLAGALGRPVWTLLPQAADWRWLLERSSSPWYPTMRLFRQKTPGDWAAVVAEVRAELKKLASTAKTRLQ